MKSVSPRSISELAATVGVLAGLLFVGVEIRNNTAVARAETRREVAAQNIEMVMRIAEDEDLMRLWSTPWTMEFFDSLSQVDQGRLTFTAIGFILRLESTYLQFEQGLLEAAGLRGYGFVQPRVDDPWFRDLWTGYRVSLDPDFVSYFETENGY